MPTKVLYKGFTCPHCVGVRLHTLRVYRPAPGLVVRTRRCSACGRRVRTEERERGTLRAMNTTTNGATP